jgi:cobalt-zinc-cadmium efflux system membrane fusion protein
MPERRPRRVHCSRFSTFLSILILLGLPGTARWMRLRAQAPAADRTATDRTTPDETVSPASEDPGVGSSPNPDVTSDARTIAFNHPELFGLAKVTTKDLTRRVTTNGAVTWDVNAAVPVLSIGGGRAIDVKAKLGDEVTKDQVLLVIDSPDMAVALAEAKKVQIAEALAEKTLQRTRYLYTHQAGPLKDMEQAENDLSQTRAERQATAERLRLMGGKPGQAAPLIQVVSPIDGTVVEQNIVRGAAVKSLDTSPNLFTVADLSRVWILCDLYENNIPDVLVGDDARVTLSAFPDKRLQAKVVHISRVLDPATRSAKVRLELPNPDRSLRPGMFATVKFISARATPSTMVPTTAVLRLHDKSWVFHSLGGKIYRRIPVNTGIALPEGILEVHGSLRPGDPVVENALQFANAVETQSQEKEDGKK